MSLSGVSNPLLSNLGTVGRPGAAGARPGQTAPLRPDQARGANLPAPAAALKPQPSLVAAGNTLPAEAPAGTDPALWSVLTSEERTYFAKAAAMGPLTYGRVAAGVNAMASNAPAAAVRGARLDVRA